MNIYLYTCEWYLYFIYVCILNISIWQYEIIIKSLTRIHARGLECTKITGYLE